MNYYKQAAGLIILIFVLAVLFMLFLSDQDDARRAEVQTESLQQDAISYSQTDQCI